MFKTSVLVAFLVFVFVFGVNAQDVDSSGAELMRSRNIAVVPSVQYPTLESALYQRKEIELLPGHYNGNYYIFTSEVIRARKPGTVTIDGGSVANTFTLDIYAHLELEGITVINSQPLGYYYTAAIQGWGGISVELKNCKIYSASIGLSTSYATYATVVDSEFIGLSENAIGIQTSLNNVIDVGAGTRIYNNKFSSLNIGIDHFDITDPGIQTVDLCGKKRRCTDSNVYSDVNIPYQFRNNLE